MVLTSRPRGKPLPATFRTSGRQHCPGIHPRGDTDDGVPRLRVSRKNRVVDGRCSPPARQERRVKVYAPQSRVVHDVLGDLLAERDDDHNVGWRQRLCVDVAGALDGQV